MDPVYVRPEKKFERIEDLYLCRECNTFVDCTGWNEQIELMKKSDDGYEWI